MHSKTRWLAPVVLASIGAITVAPTGVEAASAPTVEVTVLVRPDGTPLEDAWRINESGQIIASIYDETDARFEFDFWEDGTATNIPSPTGSNMAFASPDLNEDGLALVHDMPVLERAEPLTWHDGETTQLPTGSQFGALATDVNNRGQATGARLQRWGFPYPSTPVVWDGDVAIEVPSTSSGIVWEINDRGRSVLTLGDPGATRAATWKLGGEVTILPTIGGTAAEGFAINELGLIAGTSTTATGDTHAVVWRGGRAVDLGTLGGPTSRLSPYSPGSALNEWGHVVGTSDTADGNQHAFLWRNGRMIDLGTLGGDFSHAFAVNNRGQVVGTSTTASGEVHGFLWENGRMIDLDAHSGALSQPRDINDQGQIVAQSLFPDPNNPGGVLPTATLIET